MVVGGKEQRNEENEHSVEVESLLRPLDASQRVAVCEDLSTPLLVLAGAGSGKTLTMASRIAYMILRGVAPENILGLCFSRRAAETLRDRVAAVLPPSLALCVRLLKLKTFHAFGLECLRRHNCIDLSTEVCDARQQREIAAAVVQAHAAHHKGAEAVAALIEYVNKAKTKKDMRAGNEFDPSRQAAYLFRFYQTMLHEQRNAVDFGDIEQMFLGALRPIKQKTQEKHHGEGENGEEAVVENVGNTAVNAAPLQSPLQPSPVASKLRAQYTHIVVDEFQDLNEVQLECLALLAGDSCRVTCVGDPNQCIYTWRGAATNSFDRWKSRFPQTKLVRLETNYRSSAEIVGAVNKLTQLSQQSFKGQCGRRIILVRCKHAWEQLSLLPQVLEGILRTRDKTLTYGDIAILCRTRRTVKDVVAVLEKDQVPVCELRNSKPNSKTVIRAILAYLRLCVHPHSNIDVECVMRDAPNHFSASSATKFIFAMQAECLQRRKEFSVSMLQGEHSHTTYSYYTILRELVHNGFNHVHERLKTTKAQQKFLRTLIEVTTAAHDALGRPYCDVEEVVREVVWRAGFEENSAAGVQVRRGAVSRSKRTRSSEPVRRASSSLLGDLVGDEEDECDATDMENEAISLSDLLVEACRTVEQQILSERNATDNSGDNKPCATAVVGTPEAGGSCDSYTKLQRVIDEFLALLPTDDFGPLNKGGTKTESSHATRVTVTTVHQAKGKEWLAVVVPCCYEGEFPIDVKSAEERRVFYVALSRAMRDLVLMTADRGPSSTRCHYDDDSCGGAGGIGETGERPLQITPYLRPLLPLLETLSMPFCENAQETCVGDQHGSGTHTH